MVRLLLLCFALVAGVTANTMNCQGDICTMDMEQFRMQLLSDGAAVSLQVKQDGTTVDCTMNMVDMENLSWHATCISSTGKQGDANFVIRPGGIDEEDHVFGTIHVPDDICKLGPNEMGQAEIKCKPNSEFRDEEHLDVLEFDGLLVPDNDNDRRLFYVAKDDNDNTGKLFSGKQQGLRGSTQRTDGRRLYDDSGSNLDIMVLWTKAAECRNSGLLPGCQLNSATEMNMKGLVDLAITETNTAFQLSGVNSVLRLVHAYRDEDYEETSNRFYDSIISMQKQGDGVMDDVHAKRTLYGADLVHLIIDGTNGNACGIGYAPPSPYKDYMFSVSSHECATGYYSFGHEVAHNMGGYHDRGTMNACDVTTRFQYGYRDPDADFRSIMAYNCTVGQCDGMLSTGCDRVQRFSNTYALYNDKPMGNDENDMARHLNQYASRTAGFYPAMNCAVDADCDDNDDTTMNECNVGNGSCVYTPIVPTPSPTSFPSAGPTDSPTASPTESPTSSPTAGPTDSPSAGPTASPTVAPTDLPSASPNDLQLKPKDGTNAFMESRLLTGIKDSWRYIRFVNSYETAVITCTVQYDKGYKMTPAVVRLKQIGKQWFQIKLQNPQDNTPTGYRRVHCLIVEEGAWVLSDGRTLEAYRHLSKQTDGNGSWVGDRVTYTQNYNYPVILGQVMSYQDEAWSVFWSHGGQRWTPADRDNLYIGKHAGTDPSPRAWETLGYIVMEARNGWVDATTFDTVDRVIQVQSHRTKWRINGYVNSVESVPFEKSFAVSPKVVVASQGVQRDSDGTWAALSGAPEAVEFGAAIDKAGLSKPNRVTLKEVPFHYIGFASQISVELDRPQ